MARPPLATERLSQDARGRILYRFRHPYSDGRTHAVFTVRGFLERLCALIPAPGTHPWTYHGVLAPASSWREAVVGGGTKAERGRGVWKKTLSLDRRLRWAERMKRTFEIDVLRCECGARRRVVGWVLERGVAVRILRHLGLGWEAPVMEPSRAPPVLEFEV